MTRNTDNTPAFAVAYASEHTLTLTIAEAVEFFTRETPPAPDDDTIPGADWSADDVTRFMAGMEYNAAMRENARTQRWAAAIADYRVGNRDTLRALYERESFPPEGVGRLLAEALLTPVKAKNASKRKLMVGETERVITIIDNMKAILPAMRPPSRHPLEPSQIVQYRTRVADGVYEALADQYGMTAETIRKKYPWNVKAG